MQIKKISVAGHTCNFIKTIFLWLAISYTRILKRVHIPKTDPLILNFRSDARSEQGDTGSVPAVEDEEEEEEEILGSDDDEQEDPKDYVKGKSEFTPNKITSTFHCNILLSIFTICIIVICGGKNMCPGAV